MVVVSDVDNISSMLEKTKVEDGTLSFAGRAIKMDNGNDGKSTDWLPLSR